MSIVPRQSVHVRTMTQSAVVVLTDTRTCQRNARELLDQAHRLNYLYTRSLGFVGGVSVLWYNNKVFLCGFHNEPYDINFIVKVTPCTYNLDHLIVSCPHQCDGNICERNFVRVYYDVTRLRGVPFVNRGDTHFQHYTSVQRVSLPIVSFSVPTSCLYPMLVTGGSSPYGDLFTFMLTHACICVM